MSWVTRLVPQKSYIIEGRSDSRARSRAAHDGVTVASYIPRVITTTPGTGGRGETNMDIVIIFKSDGAAPLEDDPVVAPAALVDQPRNIRARRIGRRARARGCFEGGPCHRAETGCFVPITALFRGGRRRRETRTCHR